MHLALSLPEIVAAILHTNSRSVPFLHNCLFVNKLFSLEASRILWAECGSGHNAFAWRNDAPPMRHLVALIELDANRAQFYANFIRRLSFGTDKSLDRNTRSYLHLDEQQFHQKLTSILFPAVEYVRVEGVIENQSKALMHYATDHLKELWLSSVNAPSDEFLQVLASRSTSLRTLWISVAEDSTSNEPSGPGLTQYIQDSHSLNQLHIRDGLQHAWSPKALQAVANHRNLKAATLPDIPSAEWLTGLESTLKFSCLQDLEAGATEDALRVLVQYWHNLTTLHLQQANFSPLDSPITYVAQLPLLKSLTLELSHNFVLHARDLLALAQSCPNLKCLLFPPGELEDAILSENVTDATIAEVSKALSNLSKFCLRLDPIQLTQNSFISLCQNCPALEECELMADINFSELIKHNASVFLNLKFVRFALPDLERPRYDDPAGLAQSLKAIMPNVFTLYLFGGNEDDAVLSSKFNSRS